MEGSSGVLSKLLLKVQHAKGMPGSTISLAFGIGMSCLSSNSRKHHDLPVPWPLLGHGKWQIPHGEGSASQENAWRSPSRCLGWLLSPGHWRCDLLPWSLWRWGFFLQLCRLSHKNCFQVPYISATVATASFSQGCPSFLSINCLRISDSMLWKLLHNSSVASRKKLLTLLFQLSFFIVEPTEQKLEKEKNQKKV